MNNLSAGMILFISWILFFGFSWHEIGARYSPDSYALLMLGQNLIHGKGFASIAIRDLYATPTVYLPSTGFPPLFALLGAGADLVLKAGVSSALYLNFVVLLGLLYAWYVKASKLSDYSFVLFGVFVVFLLTNEGIYDEILAGRTIALSLLLFVWIFVLLDGRPLTAGRACGIGVLTGLMILNRFDSMIFGLLLPLVVGATTKSRLRNVALVYLCLLAVLLPWIVRNIEVFHKPWVADNSLTVFSTFPRSAQISYFKDGVPLFQADPSLWLSQRLQYLTENLKLALTLLTPYGGALLLLATVLLFVFRNRIPRKQGESRLFVNVSLLWICCNVATVSLTPFHDVRYFSISVLLLMVNTAVFLLHVVVVRADEESCSAKLPAINMYVLIAVAAMCALVLFTQRGRLSTKSDEAAYIQANVQFAPHLDKEELLGSSMAEELTYFTGRRAIYMPINVASFDANFAAWATRWNIHHIVISKQNPLYQDNTHFSLEAESGDFALLKLDYSKFGGS
ncbi:hypothetical protein [Paraburkholderia unamae]|uniref:hypothetical protein n=1 Tax=Paraburkholderia unamae TaxID=219649 RepID=UPI0011BE6434|nr:hypothetical protein [Paraburkholderia unamae]